MNYHKETEIIHVSATIEDEWLFKDWIRGIWGNHTQMTLVQVGCILCHSESIEPHEYSTPVKVVSLHDVIKLMTPMT